MKKTWERIVPVYKADRKWDIKFWQSQSSSARFNAVWKTLEEFYKLKGKKVNANTFRLQKSAETLKQAQS